MPETGGTTLNGGRATRWTSAPTRHLRVRNESLAYRDLGADGAMPIVLLTHLGATLDEWDPRVVDALAAGRRVIALDLPGIGSSAGSVPPTIKGMAGAVRAFIAALGLSRIDLMGFSLGGFVAQQVALDAPNLVRRLVLAGTGPAGGEGINRPTGAAYVYLDMLRGALARTDAKEFLFFPRTPTGKAAARDYLARIRERVMDRDTPITLKAFRTQIAAIKAWGRQQPQDLSRITAPTLIANGDHDRMVPTPLSQDLHQRIPGSALVIYPGSGHGGVFQHHEEFIPTLLAHLDD
ncbi:alpha/beta hydrolase [Actinomyces sp. ZJ308]|uniref:alpha/beta fold hydrolase n=1 Tax=Actinomyces sp. ZJ308 TaxID=2708342 RepID=UPI0014249CA2|nr:alpha/beta hydrolase [Actinomyces sp. ZJ308]